MATEFIVEGDELYLQMGGKKHKVLRAWESYSGWYWFATEIKGDIAFGFVQGFEQEWGSFSISEIESLGKYKVWELKKESIPHSGRRH